MAIDRHNINLGIVAALKAANPVTALIGNPPRVYFRTVRNVIFPWVRMDAIPNRPKFSVIGPVWIRTHNVQFSAFSTETSADSVAAIQAAIADVMDDAVSNLSFTGGSIIHTDLVIEGMPYAVDEGWQAVSEYELAVQAA